MESKPRWQDPGAILPESLTNTRVQVHYAVQWLARLARAALKSWPDDRQAALFWSTEINGLVTRKIVNDTTQFRLGLSLEEAALVLFENDRPTQSWSVDGQKDRDLGEFVREVAAKMGVDINHRALTGPLPYEDEMPAHALEARGTYAIKANAGALRELRLWTQNAFNILNEIHLDFGRVGLGPDLPKLSARNLTVLQRLQLQEGDPKQARTILIGMNLGGLYFREPFFYVSRQPGLGSLVRLPLLPPPSGWNKTPIRGLVLRSSDIVRTPGMRGSVRKILGEAIDAMERLSSGS